MSGVEAAGFVLAAIPLLISACEHYVEGVSTIKRWHKYKNELKLMRLTLNTEYTIFRDTCEKLLDGLVQPEDLEALINDPGGIAWSDSGLGRRLKERLQDSYDVYMETVKQLTAAVKDVQDKLGLDENGTPFSGDYDIFKRLKFSLSHRQRAEVMERIGKNNSTLNDLTNNSRLLEPSRRTRHFHSKKFRSIQEHADHLYALIKRRWTCNCGAPHDANLHLDARLTDLGKIRIPSLGHAHIKPQDPINFKIIFSVKTITRDATALWSWQETEIRAYDPPTNASSNQDLWKLPPSKKTIEGGNPLLDPQNAQETSNAVRKTSTRAKKGVRFASTLFEPVIDQVPTSGVEKAIRGLKDLAQISNICNTLQNSIASVAYTQQCLGILYDEGCQPLAIYLSGSSTSIPEQRRMVSLAELLERNTHRPAQQALSASGARIVYKGDRLRIALTVASSVLQLYKTPWLRNDWNKHDILINECGQTYGDQAYVSGAFSTAATARQEVQRQMMYDLVRNETLFSLGILLIELCLGQSFESLRSDEDPLNAQRTPDIFTEWSAAKRLLQSVYNEAGTRYGDATRRCILCEFDERETTLDNETFRQKFYEGVIIPLEDDVKAFEGKPIDGII